MEKSLSNSNKMKLNIDSIDYVKTLIKEIENGKSFKLTVKAEIEEELQKFQASENEIAEVLKRMGYA